MLFQKHNFLYITEFLSIATETEQIKRNNKKCNF